MILHRFFSLLVFLAFALMASTGELLAQDESEGGAGSDLTAEELELAALAAFNRGDFAEAEALFESFIDGYGSSAQAAPMIPRLRALLALSKIHLKKFAEAAEVIVKVVENPQGVPPKILEEVTFWHGVCLFLEKQYEPSRSALGNFFQKYRGSPKSVEAKMIAGVSYIIEENFAEAAAFFGEWKPNAKRKDVRGRIAVYELISLVKGEQFEKALEVVVEEFPEIENMAQIISFQNLSLEVGAHFLDEEKYYKAIRAMQRIWFKDRLITHQEQRLKKVEKVLARVERDPQQLYRSFLLKRAKLSIERELTYFRKVENFDSSLRLRLATAYIMLKRYREAALILEEMLEKMPPDPIVDQASVSLIQCWMEVFRWPKAVEAADKYLEVFGKNRKNPRLPLVYYMKAEALELDSKYAEAAIIYERVAKQFGDTDFGPKALFKQGYNLLFVEEYDRAHEVFDEFRTTYPDHRLAETCFYWKGMAYSFAKEHGQTIDQMEAYLEKYPRGSYVAEANFRIAFSYFGGQLYEEAIDEFEKFLNNFEGHRFTDEAYLLLGEAMMGVGEVEEGIDVLVRVSPLNGKFYEEAAFKIGKAFRLLEKPDKMREHFENFIDQNENSPRIAEALYWIGWTYRAEEQPEKTKEVYWAAIEKYGNDPTNYGVADIVMGLRKVYAGLEGQEELSEKFAEEIESAEAQELDTLALRLLWGRSHLEARRAPKRSRSYLLQAGKWVDPSKHNPMLIADVADAHRETGANEAAKKFYIELRKWHPRALQKDRAFAGLGLIALQEEDIPAALEYFDRFEQETISSPLYGEILLLKANLLAQDKKTQDEAKKTLVKIFEDKFVSSQYKAEALYRYGEILFAAQEWKKSTAYYEQIYIGYGRYGDLVAKSYLRRGEALEKMGEKDKALEVYFEFYKRQEELEQFPEYKEAQKRAARLGADLEELKKQEIEERERLEREEKERQEQEQKEEAETAKLAYQSS